MRIAQIAPAWLPVPPPGYGGIELVVAYLSDGLAERGHDVTLFACGGSRTKAKLVTYYDKPSHTDELLTDPLRELPHVLNAYNRAAEFDIIHDHSFPVGTTIGAFLSSPPVVHTMHGPTEDDRQRELYTLLGNRIDLVSISNYQRRGAPDLNYVGTVYNGIDLNAYSFRETKDDYLLFLGRMSPQKGAHLAAEVARRLGRRLILATKMVEPGEKSYFDSEVKPRLTNRVEVLGEITLAEKVELYANAACTLMPIQWPEPFGLVMTESMACGTPVVAFRHGSVPEIIEPGVNGFIADEIDEFASFVERSGEIKSSECRRVVEEKFSTDAMVRGYEAIYTQSLSA